ncbi:MAG TPA: TonB-dependent receptor [Sphingobium sp.]|uniref:TonB-dependent receptor n=1 Tax=Sphingobium sp. TaxID=1912891 RepID=UPI002ED57D91
MRTVGSISYLALASMLLAGGTAAQAQTVPAVEQDSAAQGGSNYGDIIVTAQKRSESINKVPLSIVAASGDQLKAAGITEVADLTKVVTGFQAVQTQVGSPIYFLRGVGYDDVSLSARPAVTLYVDEAPLPYSVMSMGSTLDLERVEVLKGPQGLLFGSNSTGGAINFVAAKPTDSLKFGMDASLGRFMQHTLSGFVSGPISEKVRARLAVSHEGGDDWQYDYVNGNKIGQKDITSGRLTLEAMPSDRLKLSLSVSGTTDRSDPQQPQFVSAASFAVSAPFRNYPATPRNNRATSFNSVGPAGKELRRDNSQWQSIIRADYEISDSISLTSLTSYVENKQEYAVDSDGTAIEVTGFGISGDLKAFSQELRLSGQFNDRSNWIIGGNIERDKTSEAAIYTVKESSTGQAFLGAPFFLGGPPFNYGGSDNTVSSAATKFRSEAIFANVDYDLTDQLTLHAGVRYTHASTAFDGQSGSGTISTPGQLTSATGLALIYGIPLSQVGPGKTFIIDTSTGTPRFVRYTDKIKENNVSWRVGLDFKPGAGTLIYGSVSRGYKAGTFSNIASSQLVQLAPVPQESVTAYEIGLKSDLIDRILHVNAAAFYYDYSAKQLQGAINVPIFGIIQALKSIPSSRVVGGEFEVTVRPTGGLTLGAMATYVDSKVTKSFLDISQFNVPMDFKGTAFPNTPKLQASASVEYRGDVSSSMDVYVGGNLTYRSTSYGDFFKDNRLKINAYALVDARLGVEAKDKAWLVELYGRNIFNKYYWTNQRRIGDGLIRYAGQPSTYGVRASFRFR